MSDERGNVDSIVWERTGVEVGGTLPTYAWPGGYPVLYFDHDAAAICADCANKRDWSDARIIGCEVFYEGADEVCENCNKVIESAYGDPDSPGLPDGGTVAKS